MLFSTKRVQNHGYSGVITILHSGIVSIRYPWLTQHS